MSNVVNLPEVGRITLKAERAKVVHLPVWRLTFCSQSAISIVTDPVQRTVIVAPGCMKVADAIAWAKRRVPEDWMLVTAHRDGGDR